MYYSALYCSPLGRITLASDEAGKLAGLWLEGQKYFLGTLSEEPVAREDLPVFAQTKDWLDQ